MSEPLQSYEITDLMFSELMQYDGAPISHTLTRRASREALQHIYHLDAPVSYLAYVNDKRVRSHFGVSLTESGRESQSGGFTLSLPAESRVVNEGRLREVVSEISNYCGLITGWLSRPLRNSHHLIEEVSNRSTGRFGVMVLAVPIPKALLFAELIDEKHDAVKTEEVGSDNQHLRQVRAGARHGMWLSGVYFFAENREQMEKIETIVSSYSLGIERGADVMFWKSAELSPHVKSFSMLKNKHEQDSITSRLYEYKYLTPLTSDELAEWIYVPGLN